MKPNTCPGCKREKGMKPVKTFAGREWPGSLCGKCGHFIPDVVSEHYDISCDGCGKAIGRKAFDRFWHDLDEEKVQALLKAEEDRAMAVRDEIGKLFRTALAEKTVESQQELERRLSKKEHLARGFGLPPSWQKRHEEQRKGYFCVDCHRQRRKDVVDFGESQSYVAHEIKCSICKKTIAMLYLGEHLDERTQLEKLEHSSMDCTKGCAAKAAEIVAGVRKVLDAASSSP